MMPRQHVSTPAKGLCKADCNQCERRHLAGLLRAPALPPPPQPAPLQPANAHLCDATQVQQRRGEGQEAGGPLAVKLDHTPGANATDSTAMHQDACRKADSSSVYYHASFCR